MSDNESESNTVCDWRRVCRNCSFLVTSDSKLECFKICCNICNNKQPSVRLCYLTPLKTGQISHRFVYFFFDTECTQDLEQRDGYFEQYRTVYVRSKCVQIVKKLRTLVSIVHLRQTCSRFLVGIHRKIY